MEDAGRSADETPKERADRELLELLNELRVVLPGITVLFAFLLAVPFAKGWTAVTRSSGTSSSSPSSPPAWRSPVAPRPSSYHRLRFRHGEKEHLVVISNRLAIAGIAAFAVASLEAAILLVVTYVVSLAAGIVAVVVVRRASLRALVRAAALGGGSETRRAR